MMSCLTFESGHFAIFINGFLFSSWLSKCEVIVAAASLRVIQPLRTDWGLFQTLSRFQPRPWNDGVFPHSSAFKGPLASQPYHWTYIGVLNAPGEERESKGSSCAPCNFLGSSSDWGVILVWVLASGPILTPVLQCRSLHFNCHQPYLLRMIAKHLLICTVHIHIFILPDQKWLLLQPQAEVISEAGSDFPPLVSV